MLPMHWTSHTIKVLVTTMLYVQMLLAKLLCM